MHIILIMCTPDLIHRGKKMPLSDTIRNRGKVQCGECKFIDPRPQPGMWDLTHKAHCTAPIKRGKKIDGHSIFSPRKCKSFRLGVKGE